MSTRAAPDPNWTASDLLEHARRLAAMASAPRGASRTDGDLVLGVRELHARCVRLETDPAVLDVRPRYRARLLEAFDRLACASDDLASIVLLRCTEPDDVPAGLGPDLPALLARVTERHDVVIGLLGRAGVGRTTPAA